MSDRGSFAAAWQSPSRVTPVTPPASEVWYMDLSRYRIGQSEKHHALRRGFEDVEAWRGIGASRTAG